MHINSRDNEKLQLLKNQTELEGLWKTMTRKI